MVYTYLLPSRQHDNIITLPGGYTYVFTVINGGLIFDPRDTVTFRYNFLY